VDDLRERLAAFCSQRLGHPVRIEELVRLSGGASREMWSFVVGDDTERRRLVLRRDPPGAPARSDRANEVELLRRAAEAGVPVPRVVWTATAAELGSPGFFMDHVDGETIARRILREDAYAGARRVMARQCGEILARIHSIPAEGLTGLPRADGPPATAVIEQYRTLLDSFGEPHPTFELALRWLDARRPPSERLTVVHGDFRNGNLIVGPDGVRAVLDWELVHIGDPWEDLAWLCMRSWRFGGPGEVGGFGHREDLYAAYEDVSGVAVDRDAVHWWEVMSNVKWGVMTIGQAFTHLWGHVPSLELAAIGRRTAETEYDVLNLILRAPTRSHSDRGAAALRAAASLRSAGPPNPPNPAKRG
jgi:aminoglycoside phosphotransferase (APT) family kinase protein